MNTPGSSTLEAYRRGLADAGGAADPFEPARLLPVELDMAVASWRAAQDQHEHTSYYGAAHIRAMRAYWIGRRRAARHETN